MTKQDFESYGFSISTKIEYRGDIYCLLGIDFDGGCLEISKIDPKSDVFIEDEDRLSILYHVCDIVHTHPGVQDCEARTNAVS